MKLEKKTTSYAGRRRSNRGFTLVELIVVLTILAILAAIGVTSAVGYINRSKLDKNNQNAITVYQAAQAALSQKAENGTMSDWVSGTLMTCDGLVGNGFPTNAQGKIEGLTNVNDSRHTTVALTYNPGASNSASQTLYGLLGPYFYDQSVFGATITVVFDVSVTYQGDGEPLLYSANVMATFYSLENPADEGWDASYIHAETDLALDDSEPWKSLPCTVLACRYKSYVGFFNGTEESLVGPVVVRDNPTAADGTLFTLRNGETLDATWCVFGDDHDPIITLNFYDASTNALVASIKADERVLDTAVSSASTQTRYESVTYLVQGEVQSYSASCNIIRTYQDGVASVTLVKPDGSEVPINMPITKTVVDGDARNEVTSYLPTGTSTYTTYTLSLDCMMTRSSYDANPLYSSARIFGNTPINVYASIIVGNAAQTTEPLYATRAINDPIYSRGVDRESYANNGSHTAFIYDVYSATFKNGRVEPSAVGAASCDTTERCVVNTVFGDYNYNDDGVQSNPISGYRVNTQNNYDVVITSARHLSNIRRINQTTSTPKYHYHIVRDINWYYPATSETMPVSEVRVYTSAGNYNSPVKNSNLQVVSFPSISVLNAYETMSAERHDPYNGGDLCSINNVQMRVASFSSSDTGYGLIGENKGCIYNVSTDYLTIVLTNSVSDGDSSDLGSIYVDTPSFDGQGTLCGLNKKPVGGLVGLNNGTLGLDSTSTITMNNCAVMAGDYWHAANYGDDNSGAGIGGVVGNNKTSQINGLISVNGNCVVFGHRNVGGVIGFNNGNLDATLSVTIDGIIASSPVTGANNTGNNVGGVIGQNKAQINAPITAVISGTVTGNDGVGGVIGKNTKSVTSTISSTVTGTVNGSKNVGGVIGCSVESISLSSTITAVIHGNIICSGDNVGGAIGDNKSTVSTIQLTLESTGQITGKSGVGGAIGYNENGTISSALNIEIAGTITATGNNVGGVIGSNGGNVNAALTVTVSGSITGKEGVGGIIGKNTKALSKNLTSTITATGSINGTKNVGGALGFSGEITVSSQITVVLSGKVISSGDNAGGVVGDTKSHFTGAIQMSFESTGEIKGKNGVGGVIGFLESGNGKLNSALNVNIAGTITSTGNNVGGIIGSNDGSINANLTATVSGSITGKECVGAIIGKNTRDISKNLTSTITGSISGTNYVGGAIGSNSGSIKSITVAINGPLSGSGNSVGGAIGKNSANLSNLNVSISGSSSVTGAKYVGGVIGYNEGSVSFSNGSFTIPISVNGGESAGGVIGYNTNSVNGINVTISGTVKGTKNVGGAIGSNTAAFSNNISATISSEGKVYSEVVNDDNNVGGAIGSNSGNVNSITTVINGTLSGSGNSVGGAIGNNSADITGLTVNISGSSPVTGANHVGGVIGYNNGSVAFSNNALTIPVSVSGGNNVGGVIGYNNKAVSGINVTITSTVKGTKNVGGAIGNNNAALANGILVTISNTGKVISEVVNDDNNVGGAIGYNSADVISITSVINGTLSGSGNSVGGAIGKNEATITGLIVNVSGSSPVTGANHVGGVIGYNNGSVTFNSNAFTIPITVNGGDNIGGVIGYNNKAVSGINVTISGTVQGTKNVGGVIGSNAATLSSGTSVTITGTVKSTTANADNNVGGAIGYNSADVSSFTVVINGTLSGSGNSVGGVIGNNTATITSLTVNISGSSPVTGANHVGGVIGYNDGSVTFNSNAFTMPIAINGGENVGGVIGYNNKAVSGINVTISGTVQGTKNIGGAIGSNNSAVASVTVIINSNITSVSSSTGENNIGGVIGYNTGAMTGFKPNVSGTGSITGNGNNVGGIIGNNNASVTFADSVLVGVPVTGIENIGGLVGYNQQALSGVNVTIASSVTGTKNIGGAIGSNIATITSNMTVTIDNSGTVTCAVVNADNNIGGVIGINSGTIGSDSSSITISVVVNGTLSGSGNNVGGIIGSNTNKIKKLNPIISASTPIVGVNNVGGVIGSMSSGSISGGLGSTNNEVSMSNVVITGQNCVGGVIGKLSGGEVTGGIHINIIASRISGTNMVGGVIGNMSGGIVKGGIIETLDASYVTGVEEIGGAIGYMSAGTLADGCPGEESVLVNIAVSLVNDTNIGDIESSNDYHCIDVGGAVGYVNHGVSITNGIIAVTVDDTSLIFAGGVNSDDSIVCGVGGVFGRLGKLNGGTNPSLSFWNKPSHNLPYLSLYCESSEPCIVSNSSPVGGVIGRMLSGKIQRSYSTAVVSGVNYVGGFVGRVDSGEIGNSYASGHTVNGVYDINSINVSGSGSNVGGFAGYIGSGVSKLFECYSTASVRGLNNVGGFVGCIDNNKSNIIYNTYCTGLVLRVETTDPNPAYVGAYAGYISNINVLKSDANVNTPKKQNETNKVLQEANSGLPRVGNIVEDTTLDTRICWSPYGVGPDEYGGRYIRNRANSAYEVSPFDDGLELVFPYRTYISYDRGGSTGWFGEHVGDWPVYGQSSVTILNNENTEVSINAIDYRYGDDRFDPTVTVIYDPDGEHRILNSQDYQITFYDDTHAGTARYHIVGIPTRGYGGQINGTYQINPVDLNSNLIEVVITGGDSRDYTGEPITPAVTVSYYNSRLGRAVSVPSAEYEVTYGENINAGVGTITITAVAGANCTGQRVIEFTINPVDISGATITLEQRSYPYTGSAIEPVVTSVRVGDTEIPNTGYTVSYENNVAVGSDAIVRVTGTGNYSESAQTTFTIEANLTDACVSMDSEYVYNGSAQTPNVVVIVNGVTLTEGTDYTLSYPDGQDMVNVRTGLRVTITGIGNYSGTVERTFDIIAATTTPPQETSSTGNGDDGNDSSGATPENLTDPPTEGG